MHRSIMNKSFTKEHPENDFVWEENAEVGFLEWFNGNYGKFSCRSEWFYGDCEVEDEKIRKDLVYNWVRSAYLSGYEMGGALDELAQKTPQGTPDTL